MRTNFQADSLKALNERLPADKHYAFGLKSGSAMGLESDLMIYEDEIGIDSKGTGKQIFIKTILHLNALVRILTSFLSKNQKTT